MAFSENLANETLETPRRGPARKEKVEPMNYWVRGASKWLPMVVTVVVLLWALGLLVDRKTFENVAPVEPLDSLPSKEESSVAETPSDEPVDLDDPVEVRRLKSKASSVFQVRGREGEELVYLPNQSEPFSGWLKKTLKDGSQVLWEVKDGDRHGPYLEFFNELKTLTQHYAKGELNGSSIEWFENGQKKKEVNFRRGRKEGLQSGWFANGQKNYEQNYRADQREGLFKSWYANSNPKQVGAYRKGRLHGPFTEWYEDGQKKEVWNYKGDLPDGPYESWHPNGKKRNEHYYKEGKTHGAYLSWHANGNKRYDGSYLSGEKTGLWILYNEDGSELNRKSYEKGREVPAK